ncbi:trypsin-like peptidase domain-containing protein [Actinoplanes hulinensis]|uniref:Trypsin-like peptidase domain-containing protein n=1 Tax=Actinoplanes hulinensis TaxID=1144547 RepID=A0ABS7B5A7_9ACTN|nr:trypsin-like peptidase domain-containing protein [Actinoplanes hulinensis]MBW6436196.1 trypsin-like peptidase domain-containing protein [Actinoplanes hulinensis]
MTAPFEPFTPANGSGGHRRAQEWAWEDDRSWNQQPQQQQQPAYDPWGQQQQQQQQWAPEPQWAQQQQQQQSQWSQPVYETPQQPVYEPAPAPAPTSKRARGRTIAIGLVAALLLVTAWQAFRVETMIQSSNDLASAVNAEQGRSQELEKQLATVFDPEGIAKSVLPSVFRVRAGDFTGTAFAVGQANGRTNLFTNFHVVEEVWTGGDRAVSLERGNTRIDATIVKVSEGRDLALLRTNADITPLGVAADEVKPGQQVMVVGAPLGLEDSVTTGVISAYRPDAEDGPTIQFDAPINPGNSGGPVVNSSKKVVGLATAKARDAEGIGLAIPIETACQTLGACGNG